eukprot:COSAG05_NODE_1764_length_4122_cov_3.430524_4_plen_164_part_00
MKLPFGGRSSAVVRDVSCGLPVTTRAPTQAGAWLSVVPKLRHSSAELLITLIECEICVSFGRFRLVRMGFRAMGKSMSEERQEMTDVVKIKSTRPVDVPPEMQASPDDPNLINRSWSSEGWLSIISSSPEHSIASQEVVRANPQMHCLAPCNSDTALKIMLRR